MFTILNLIFFEGSFYPRGFDEFFGLETFHFWLPVFVLFDTFLDFLNNKKLF